MKISLRQCIGMLSILLIVACSSGGFYRAEKYVAYDSADAIGNLIFQSIRADSVEQMLELMQNDTLVLDILGQTKTEEARHLNMRISTKSGQLLFTKECMGKRERIKAFFLSILGQTFVVSPTEFRLNGMELLREEAFGEGTNAVRQHYALSFSNGDAKEYRLNIQLVLWNDKYHLVEVDSFFS
jgi:hypothetical protein